MWVTVLAGQAQVHRAGVASLPAGLTRQLNVFEEHALIGIEIGVDPVGADQRGQQALPGIDQVAGGDLRAADAPIDGGDNPGKAQVETGVIQLRLDAGHCGLGFCGGAGAGIGQLGGNGIALAQTLAAAGFAGGAQRLSTGLLQLGFEALDLGLERPWIDLEQQIAFAHQAAFVEGDLVNKAGYPRANLNGLGGLQAAGKFVPFVDRLFDDFGHADFCHRHLLHGFRGLATGAQQQAEGKRQGQAPVEGVGLFHE